MSIPKAAIILQARCGSTRLPRKILALLNGRSLLAHCLGRLRIGGAAPVVLATTTLAEDDRAVEEASEFMAVRGPADDVLGRYVLAGRLAGAPLVMRATADNPAVDLAAAGRVLECLRVSGADYVCERGLPLGGGVEGVRLDALERAAVCTSHPYDREHVTPFIRRHPDRFRMVEISAPAAVARPDLRLTVDTPADLEFMRALIAAAENARAWPAPLQAIIRAADVVAGRREVA